MHGFMPKPLTPELVAEVAGMVKAGKSFAQIAKATGRSRSSIAGIVARKLRGGAPVARGRRDLSEAERAEALRRYGGTAENVAAIAARFGVTALAIKSLARDAGVTREARRGFGGAVTALRVTRKRVVNPADALPEADLPPGDMMARLFTPEAAAPRNLLLGALAKSDCRWPVAGAGADTLFCGHAADEGAAYCAAHRTKARGTGTVSERKAALTAPRRAK